MSAHLAAVVERLRTEGIVTDAQAGFFRRVARGELLSIRAELLALLWGGVMLIATGLGLLVKTHYDEIGPLAVTLILAVATALSFAYVVRRAGPFSRGEVPSPTLAFDYLLLLGVLLLGTDIAWIEYRWALLGKEWPWHLLIVSLVCLPVAYRFDSRAVLSLALTTFAAWRGISASHLLHDVHTSGAPEVRANAIAVGALFLAGAALSRLSRVKAHFEQVYGNLGLALLLGALLSGTVGRGVEGAWGAALFVAAAAAGGAGWTLARADYFAIAVVAAYAGFLRFFLEEWHDEGALLLVAASAIGVVLALLAARRRMRQDS